MRFVLVAVLCLALLAPVAQAARGDATVAGVQVALARRGYYAGTIDGLAGAETTAAIQRLQRANSFPVDGRLSAATRAALGPFAARTLGSRLLCRGIVGSDVASLQFLLAWHGFPSSNFRGVFDGHVAAAVLAFQRWSQLPPTGVAGPLTLAALRADPPEVTLPLLWPLRLPVANVFGPRHQRFHTGIDIPAPTGRPVRSAAAGTVLAAGWSSGGWGYRVAVAHAGGLQTISAHLSRVDVRVGQRVRGGDVIGRVGSSGDARGPHLHFEARLRDASIDPLPALR